MGAHRYSAVFNSDFCKKNVLVQPSSGLKELWVGTAPWCGGIPSDCTDRGMKYIRSDATGGVGDKTCWKGEKVLCQNPPSVKDKGGMYNWMNPSPDQFCQTLGGQRALAYIHEPCLTSDMKRSMDEALGSSGLKELWVGTAPFCGGEPSDCTDLGMKYIRSEATGGDFDSTCTCLLGMCTCTCTSGNKVLCRKQNPPSSSGLNKVALMKKNCEKKHGLVDEKSWKLVDYRKACTGKSFGSSCTGGISRIPSATSRNDNEREWSAVLCGYPTEEEYQM